MQYAASWSGDSDAYTEAGSALTQIVGMSCAYPGRADPAANASLASLHSSTLVPLVGGGSAFLAAALAGDDIPTLVPAERHADLAHFHLPVPVLIHSCTAKNSCSAC